MLQFFYFDSSILTFHCAVSSSPPDVFYLEHDEQLFTSINNFRSTDCDQTIL